MGQAAQEAEGENSLSTVEELLARVDMSRYEVAREEDEMNPVTTADHLAAVSLREGVAREENDREHLARAIKRPRVNMSPEAVAREEEGLRESEGVHPTLEEAIAARDGAREGADPHTHLIVADCWVCSPYFSPRLKSIVYLPHSLEFIPTKSTPRFP